MSSLFGKMESIGKTIRARRESLGLLLRHVAAALDIDQAVLSKIERSERRPTRDNIVKLAEVLGLDKEELLVDFMSEKIAYEIAEEDCADKVLRAAEKKVKYIRANIVKD